MTAEKLTAYGLIALCFCIVAVLQLLAVVLCREWVKRDLQVKLCQPIQIRWRPFGLRTNSITCSFRVLYSDLHGRVHRAIAWTSWLRPNVNWEQDEIIDDPQRPVSRGG